MLASKHDVSSDGLTYTFTLRKGTTFQDGKDVTADDVDATRDVLNTIHPGAKKLHWRDLDGARRDRVTSAIASLRAAHLVVVGSPVALRRQERARAFCLRRLLWELDAQGVSKLSLEARPAELM
ncbi:hypothetical protein IAE22_29415, partial [Bacillus sp. S34]|nr:hypothetical protein [Bacillus sp. S34]